MNYIFNINKFIEFLEANKDNKEELIKYLGEKFYNDTQNYPDYRTKSNLFLGAFETVGILIYVNKVYSVVKHNNLILKEPIKEISRYQGSAMPECLIRGDKYQVSEEIISNFFEEEEDLISKYKDKTQSELAIPGVNSLVSNENLGNSVAEVENNKSDLEAKMKEYEEKKKQMLAELEKEYQLKVSAMKLELSKQMAPIVKSIGESKNTLSDMESQIYRWLTYNGHSFELKKLCSGDNASDGDKFVIWQKLRYLDEELPRLTMTKDVDYSEFTTFENLLTKYKVIRDFFLPTTKCCVAFQLSKSSVVYRGGFSIKAEARDNKIKSWIEYVEYAYEVANYNKLGLFFRNGDNVYVAWLDQDKIAVHSDSLFLSENDNEEYKPNFLEYKNVEDWVEKDRGQVSLDNLEYLEHNYDENIKLKKRYNARVYILDAIQGLLDNNPEVMTLPENQNVLQALLDKSYKDIIFNSADAYIENLKWKNYEEISKEFEVKDHTYGEPIYVLLSDGGKERGRVGGYVDRTSYYSLRKGLSKINLIEYKDTYTFTYKADKSNFVKVNSEESGEYYQFKFNDGSVFDNNK